MIEHGKLALLQSTVQDFLIITITNTHHYEHTSSLSLTLTLTLTLTHLVLSARTIRTILDYGCAEGAITAALCR